jgi:hypothetical protein
MLGLNISCSSGYPDSRLSVVFLSHPRQLMEHYIKKLCGLRPQTNCADQATAACRRSWCQLLRIEGVALSAQRTPTAVFSTF